MAAASSACSKQYDCRLVLLAMQALTCLDLQAIKDTARFMLICVSSLLQMCRTHTKHKYYSQKQALEWIMQIAAGLKYLHTLRPKVVLSIQTISVLQSMHSSHTAQGFGPFASDNASLTQVVWRDAKLENILLRSKSHCPIFAMHCDA